LGGVLLCALGLVETGPQQRPGTLFVLRLRFVLGHFEANAGGLVEELPAGFDLVDVLSTRPAAAAAGFFDILGIDVDFYIRHFGEDGHRGGAGVDATLCFGLRDTLYPMPAAFKLEMAEGAGSFDVGNDFLE